MKIFLVTLLASTFSIAQERLPDAFTYQGRAFQSDGVTPLTGTATFNVEVRSANGSCLLYQESHAGIDLTASNGFFALNIGEGSAASGLNMADAFSNNNTSKLTLSGTCGGTYTPLNLDTRVLRVSVNTGSGPVALDDQYIYSVPTALVADTLNGYKYTQFVQSLTTAQRDALTSMVNGTTIYNITTGRFNRYNGVTWSEAFGATNLGAGSQIFASKVVGNDWLQFRSIIGSNGVTATQNANDITLAIDTNYTQRRVSGTCGAGNFITGINQDGTVSCAPDATGGAGTVSTDNDTINGDGSVGDPLEVVEANLTLSNIGGQISLAQLPTCTASQILKRNAGNTAWECAADAAGGGGGVSTVTATNATIVVGGTAADPTIGVGSIGSSNITDGAIATIDLSDDVVTAAKMADQSIDAPAKFAGALGSALSCSNNQLLSWSGSNWACVNAVSDTNTTYSAGNSLTLTGTTFTINTTDIATCVNTTTQKIVWDSTNNRLACATDAGASGGLSSALAQARIYVGDSGGTAVARDVTGDVEISDTGVVTIQNNAVETAMIADDQVTAAKIADNAIDDVAKLATGLCAANQILKKRSDNTAWECAADATGAGGETNTASNQGTGGVGVYDTKVGTDLQFRNISAEAGNEVSVTLSTKNIVLDVVEANLDLDAIGGVLGYDQLANCPANQILQQNVSGNAWTCVNLPAGVASVTAGSGLANSGTATNPTLDVNVDNSTVEINADILRVKDLGITTAKLNDGAVTTVKIGDDQVTAAKIADGAIDALAKLGNLGCSDGQVLKWSTAGAGSWSCQNDAGAGGGSENTSAINVGTGSQVFKAQNVDELQFRSITSNNTITRTQNADDINLAVNEANLTLSNMNGQISLAQLPTCTANQILKRNAGNTAWECAVDADANTTYSAGSGLTLTGTTFSIGTGQVTSTMILDGTIATADIGDDQVTAAKIADNAIDDVAKLATGLCAANQVLKKNAGNTAWECAADATGAGGETNTASNQGTGGVGVYDTKVGADLQFRNISAEAGNEVSVTLSTKNIVLDVVEANLDLDAIGGVLGYDQLANCPANQVLQQNVTGTAWTCVNPSAFDTNTTYSAGSGLTLTGTTFSIGTGQVTSTMILDSTIATADIGNAQVTAGKIADGAIDATTKLAAGLCADGQILKKAAGVWTCGADTDTDTNTTYSAGSGLTLTGTTFSIGTGQVTSTMILDGTVTSTDISDGTIATADLSAMGCAANQILKRDGTNTSWICAADTDTDTNTTYSAGSGLTLTGTTFSIGTGQVTGTMILDGTVASADIADGTVTSTDISDGTIATADLSAMGCAANQILKRDGTNTSWICAADTDTDTNTTYSAGSGLTLTGTTFSIGTGQVTGTMILDGTVASADIADGSVTTTDIADGTITTTDLNLTSVDARYINSTGDTMSGALAMSGQKITGLGTPTASDDAATKAYVDAAAGSPKEIRVKSHGVRSAPACDSGFTAVGTMFPTSAAGCYTARTQTGWLTGSAYINNAGFVLTHNTNVDDSSAQVVNVYINGSLIVSVLCNSSSAPIYNAGANWGISICQAN